MNWKTTLFQRKWYLNSEMKILTSLTKRFYGNITATRAWMDT